MFRRRNKPGLMARMRDMVWPRIGWRRSSRYIVHRVGRMPGTPYTIAAGLASGAAASCTPFIGGHFILGGILAFLVRGNIIASAIGTLVGNPWSFPFIWLAIYNLGALVAGKPSADAVDFVNLFSRAWEALINVNLDRFTDEIWPVLWPMILGSIPLAFGMWQAVFWPARALVRSYQRHRARRLFQRRQRELATQNRQMGREAT